MARRAAGVARHRCRRRPAGTFADIDEQAAQIERANRSAEQITVFRDRVRFIGPKLLQAGDRRISADQVVIAAGTRPWILDIAGLDQVTAHTTDSFGRADLQVLRS